MLCALLPMCFARFAQPFALEGTWSGSVAISHGAKVVESGKALLWLGHSGAELEGAIGDGPEKLKPVAHQTRSGESVEFTFKVGGSELRVKLRRTKEGLIGAGEGGGTGFSFRLTRAPGLHPRYEEIAQADAGLFDAFNRRDLTTVQSFFGKNLEFYHDNDGLTGYAQNVDSFRRHFAESSKVRRELEPETLEVYPVKNFGAIEAGVQWFYTKDPGQPERLTATAKFVNVWKMQGGKWRIVRAVSYDH